MWILHIQQTLTNLLQVQFCLIRHMAKLKQCLSMTWTWLLLAHSAHKESWSLWWWQQCWAFWWQKRIRNKNSCQKYGTIWMPILTSGTVHSSNSWLGNQQIGARHPLPSSPLSHSKHHLEWPRLTNNYPHLFLRLPCFFSLVYQQSASLLHQHPPTHLLSIMLHWWCPHHICFLPHIYPQ